MTSPINNNDRFINRAPRGGMVSPVNGIFYKGGQFMPMASAPIEVKPAPLVGSSRQVAWAARIRKEAIARLEEQLYIHRLELASPHPFDADATRRAIRRDEVARYRLSSERSASKLIQIRSQIGI